jgi:hypothetical protein
MLSYESKLRLSRAQAVAIDEAIRQAPVRQLGKSAATGGAGVPDTPAAA